MALRSPKRKIVYIAHAIGGSIEENLADLRRIIRILNTEPQYQAIVPFCPYYADVVSLDDNNPEMRTRGLSNDFEILGRGMVDELWLTGTMITYGMELEKNIATVRRIPIIDYTNKL